MDRERRRGGGGFVHPFSSHLAGKQASESEEHGEHGEHGEVFEPSAMSRPTFLGLPPGSEESRVATVPFFGGLCRVV